MVDPRLPDRVRVTLTRVHMPDPKLSAASGSLPPATMAGGGRAADHRSAPRYEEVERQYASLPRRGGPLDPTEYPMPPWSGHYPGPPQGYPLSPSYPNPSPQPAPSYSGYPPAQPYARPGADPGYYPHPSSQQRGPLRQDVPPSPAPPLRGPRYDTVARGAAGGAYRRLAGPGPDQYAHAGEGGRQQQQHRTNPRQKNAVTAAV
ncbi:partitioning defective 3 homolog B-like [Pungitius pungitius]|uniref:partitioning defective 3 homolog B-like n=1 Tax=Pungitius pungitius TaxID=134920 RepID=UPI002E129E06